MELPSIQPLLCTVGCGLPTCRNFYNYLLIKSMSSLILPKVVTDITPVDLLRQEIKGFKATRVHLTYPSFISEETLTIFTSECKWWSMCHEIGKTGHEHTHLLLWFPKQKSISPKKTFNVLDIHPNIKNVFTLEHWQNIWAYHTKAPRFLKQTEPHGTQQEEAVKLIEACETWGQVIRLKGIDMERNFRWAQEIYNTKGYGDILGDIDEMIASVPWCSEILEWVEDFPAMRHLILWVWSKASGTGKSTAATVLALKCGALPITDLRHTVESYDGEKVLFLDIPRGVMPPYDLLEQLSNRTILASGLYKSSKKYVKAHIIVFSNDPPPVEALPKRLACMCVDGKDPKIQLGHLPYEMISKINRGIPPDKIFLGHRSMIAIQEAPPGGVGAGVS